MTEEKKVVSIEDRIPRLREARRKQANRRFIFYFTILLVLIVLVVYLQSPLSYVRKVKVTGSQFISEEIILKQSHLSTEQSLWSFQLKDIEAAILALPEIESAEVKRLWSHTVTINVTEHKKIAYIDQGDYLAPLLESGHTLDYVEKVDYKGDAPLLIGFDDEEIRQLMIEGLQALPSYLLSHISEIYHQPTEANPYQVHLNMIDGFELLTTIRGFSEHLKVYPSVVSQLDKENPGLIEIDHSGAIFNQFSNEDTTDPDLEIYEEGEENQLIIEEDE
ncbi:cell division protein FtsQ [Halolactibacillus halophilus]|uniref:Cell division protein DivIB n=1 Tax=Halolactibacillus halophilus TaxID=306540 RepID=A0A1I5LRF5_9BACI|nr:FtsQ-type POTRA domain-containing protein [Halolactibacillus halophilus]GEM00692.1 cell division protein DivIB [Halolactibacillus halophilus]SFO99820.1 cell division protein FtsQ [Halolactibacillus halophilus]